MWGVDRGERPDVAVRLLPIGGFVEFPRYLNRTKLLDAGYERDDVEELLESAITDPADPDLLENRPPREQASRDSPRFAACAQCRDRWRAIRRVSRRLNRSKRCAARG